SARDYTPARQVRRAKCRSCGRGMRTGNSVVARMSEATCGDPDIASLMRATEPRLIRTPIEDGLVGLVLVGEVDGLVLAQGEIDIAQHLAAARPLALDMDRKRVALALLVQDSAEAEHRVDVLERDLHPRHGGVGTGAGLVFGVGTDERKVVLALYRCCERGQCDNPQRSHCSCEHFAPSQRDAAGPGL